MKAGNAPQAMVINRKGNSAPEKTGPLPSIKREIAGIFISGMAKECRSPPTITPIFRKVER